MGTNELRASFSGNNCLYGREHDMWSWAVVALELFDGYTWERNRGDLVTESWAKYCSRHPSLGSLNSSPQALFETIMDAFPIIDDPPPPNFPPSGPSGSRSSESSVTLSVAVGSSLLLSTSAPSSPLLNGQNSPVISADRMRLIAHRLMSANLTGNDLIRLSRDRFDSVDFLYPGMQLFCRYMFIFFV